MLLPNFIKPMEPLVKDEPFDSPNYLFQVKWDGVRCLAYLDDEPRLVNRRGNQRTQQYPELLAALHKLSGTGIILDGEILALDSQGKPNFRRVLRRDLVRHGAKSKLLVTQVPISYQVFDIVYHDYQHLGHQPLEQRQELLNIVMEKLGDSPLIQQVESFYHQGRALFQAVATQGMEGILAKELSSPYLIGQKTSHWYKIKCWRYQRAVICGLLVKNNQLRSLLLGAYDQNRQLIYIGNGSSGLTQKTSKLLLEQAADNKNKREKAPVANPPAKLAGELVWLEPTIVVLVKYLEWTDDLKFRSPVIQDFLSEAPQSATLE